MTDPYPEARRRQKLDNTDHGRLIEENRAALLRDECDRLRDEIKTLERAADVVPHSDEIQRELAAKRDELERKGSMLERCHGRR